MCPSELARLQSRLAPEGSQAGVTTITQIIVTDKMKGQDNGMVNQQSNDERMRELALFAGAGGGILGGKLLGWRTVCAVEWDAYAASVLVARQNDGCLEAFPVWDNVETFDGRPWRGLVDVVSGGFPCTDISSAGKGAGIDGEASGMWRHMARIVGEVRRNSSSWKTHHSLFAEDLPESSVILPKWGMMHDGELWERTMSEETTTETGYGFWPTPVTSECRDTWSKPAALAKLYKGDRVARFLCKSWLTYNLPERVTLNPSWQEERMMFPTEWTALEQLEMPKFQEWLNSHGEFSEESK
jgi:hypothetical protein